MFPSQTGNLDLDALSGICGSISIACWVVVFSPQIIENFRRGSADGLSLLFLVVWLAGDVFNILGAVLQGVLPTMIILAVYYTLADIVLLGQCFYYRGFTLRDEPSGASSPTEVITDDALPQQRKPTERTSLLSKANGQSYQNQGQDRYNQNSQEGPAASTSQTPQILSHADHRRHSATSFREIIHPAVDGTHLSPVTPFVEPTSQKKLSARRISTLQTTLFNSTAIALVCAAGVVGWYVSPSSSKNKDQAPPGDDSGAPPLAFDTLGQVFGYLCAILYLGSRLPQILLNYRRKSTEGVSLLFFLFACIGNLTYVLSILAFSPVCAGDSHHCRPGEATALYGRYILVNLSWLIGSFGTLLLDMGIFVQFFLYKDNEDELNDVD
ncbi:PQ-loop repeat-containing protein [Aspergillus clavatus NRRL 1]|uniref:PQ loop repeat protein n=1 Tax=Aspergillus clavatus (strain ATCC 1007 / CBS 513.65 / DSM 816 / NCTC 3887 / NRRL 1 / QM 1276 / 107) TaxID=344612 RepID=A1C4S8_ASPCL|nr:PQ loop repeat protein [Aspergillus clavatus NRRL 1]EAW14696.1 PQ loop repeat protein [Aspergillus clavatus NRRL 1]